jgi:hypothetical protein
MAIISKLFVIILFYNSEVLGSLLTIMALFYFIFWFLFAKHNTCFSMLQHAIELYKMMCPIVSMPMKFIKVYLSPFVQSKLIYIFGC